MKPLLLIGLLLISATSFSSTQPQYDHFGRLVLDADGLQIEYPSEPDELPATPTEKPLKAESRKMASFDLPLETENKYGKFNLEGIRRFAFQGEAPGYQGLFAADHDGDGRSELFVAEDRNGEGYWYVMGYNQGQYFKKFISNVSQTPLAELNTAVWEGENAIISISEGGEGAVHRVNDFVVLETFELPASVLEVRNFSYVKDPISGDRLLFVVYGYWEGPLVVYSYPSMDIVWESVVPHSHVTDVEVANLDADAGLEVAILESNELRILDWDSQSIQWSFEFPQSSTHVKVGNFDGDPGLEVAGISDWNTAFVADVSDQSVHFIPGLGDLESLSLADINHDGIDELIIGEGQWGATLIFDAQDFSALAQVANPEHGVGATAVADFDGDDQLELAWGAGRTSTGPDILGVADLQSGIMEWSSINEGLFHDLLRIANVDADSGADLVLVSSHGEPSGRIHVIDYVTGMEKWRSAPFSGGLAWYGHVSFDLLQFDEDPQLEIVVAASRHYTPRIEVYDGSNGSLQAGFNLSPDFTLDQYRKIRAIKLNGTHYFAVHLANQIRLVDWQGQVVWSSIETAADPIEFWVQDVDMDGSQELVAVMQDGIALYELPATAPKQFHAATITSAVLADLGSDGVRELLVGKVDGNIQALNLNGFSLVDEFQMPHAVQSFSYEPGFLGFGVLVASGDNRVSLMRLDREEITSIVEFPGWLFGQETVVDVHGRNLRIAVGSSYAVHDILLAFDDLIFASGME